jgi:uncharacterized protein (UPF0264 family)
MDGHRLPGAAVKMLVSARDEAEARDAATAGADLIDLKEPADGALGAVALPRLRSVLQMLRAGWPGRRVSATIGDLAPARHDAITAAVAALAATGIDYVKVGVPGCGDRATSMVLLERLLPLAPGRLVPVLLVDDGLDAALVDAAVRLPLAGLMVDTADKAAGSLLARIDTTMLARFVATVRAAGPLVGLAGALRADDVAAVRALAPDFAGFRSAVCDGARTGRLSGTKVAALRTRLQAPACAAAADAR